MEDKTSTFMGELVKLLIEATQSPTGVPATLIREKEIELEKKKQKIKETQELGERLKKLNAAKQESDVKVKSD